MKRVVSIGLILVFVVLVGCFFWFNSVNIDVEINPKSATTTADETPANETATTNDPTVEAAPGTPPPGRNEAAPEPETLTIDISTLPESQRTLLGTLGIEGDTLVITPAVRTCAEEKLGEVRLMEIVNGDTPSLSEGFSLVMCYRDN